MSDTAAAPEVSASPSTMEECIPVKIFSKYVEVVSSSGASKFVSLNEFISMISAVSGIVKEEEPLLLPLNTYAVVRGPETLKVAMYFPEEVRNVDHNDNTHTIPWPNTIIVLNLKLNERDGSWTKSGAMYFCTPKTLGELNGLIPNGHNAAEQIFRMPFPNFYENHEMCYGNNTMPVAAPKGDIRGFKYYYDVIFVSPFNNDLGTRGFRGIDGPNDLFQTLHGLDRFPYDRLA